MECEDAHWLVLEEAVKEKVATNPEEGEQGKYRHIIFHVVKISISN